MLVQDTPICYGIDLFIALYIVNILHSCSYIFKIITLFFPVSFDKWGGVSRGLGEGCVCVLPLFSISYVPREGDGAENIYYFADLYQYRL